MLFAVAAEAAAQSPLYIVNGVQREEIASIPPDDIEQVEMLPADEESIARYGEGASHGVMLVTLRYDRAAVFSGGESLSGYIAQQVEWGDDEPAARVIVRYTINPAGTLEIGQTLESTDARFKRRVLKALEEAPAWTPASKQGTPVASEGVMRIQLPEGKPIPRKVELVYR